ncbi:hypothetical protein A5731_16715 [Mycolicibacterium conceptionense]|jgi:quercetin dioxygenase-like cupin family protein|uniref:Cupin type-2 domain-containing protein n=1 Tax=Mycolicibacterium conceptionense TaxID=451644 RepID=A0A1A1XWT9_9MYCO|nr:MULTISPECIES: cupin domain-containing protein [Mycolicibacterium]MCW1824123.1 cupin domain-containing protein [Mycolicibacterium senegalense]OBB07715.1 hypothetical protein A5718_16390 [Mycolicibacterium conceptionense]OBF02002.1 hypothetical protein A5731_16715 [Mycolicibacterium conceptionense]OBF23559.1 hypothetical protein A5726_12015 [Mycolicibacterium conceptionense]OBF44509.1 hypothetical protein A5720_11270 [Mycolicibacterium conceptionense]
MITKALLAAAVAAMVVGCGAPAAKSEPPNLASRNLTSAIVTFPPGAQVAPHRHGDAFVFAYVLEGAVSNQLEGEPAHVHRQGENWFEEPDANDVAIKNVSSTDPAKLLVVFILITAQPPKADGRPG